MQISIVIPLLDEGRSLPELYPWITGIMKDNSYSYEIIFIDDGSRDDSWQKIKRFAEKDPAIKGVHFKLNYGKSQALHEGFKLARGKVVVTMDADLQDSPEEIPEMYRLIMEEGFDLISGWKKVRHDSYFTKNLPSKLFNMAARKTSGLKLHDFNCGLKAYKKEVVKSIKVDGEMHRYLPVLVKNAGFTKIDEKEVKHQARKYGKTKFGMERFIHGFLDLITIWFFSRFGKRPMHLFGAGGVLMFIIGFVAALLLGISKLYKMANNLPSSLIALNPWFYIALIVMVLGTLLFLAGFLGELILQNQNDNDRYRISKTINIDEESHESLV